MSINDQVCAVIMELELQSVQGSYNRVLLITVYQNEKNIVCTEYIVIHV